MASASAGISSTSVTNLIQYRHFTASAVSKLASIYRTRAHRPHTIRSAQPLALVTSVTTVYATANKPIGNA